MKAAVATTERLLLIDFETKNSQVIEKKRGTYYGISWWENKDFLVLSNVGALTTDLDSLEAYALSETGYLSFGPEKISSYFLSDPHQILCAPNNWVITTNSGRNRITLYDPSSHFLKDVYITDIRWDRFQGDRFGSHFNSVYLKNDSLFVLAHNFNSGSFVLEFSYPDCELMNTYPMQYQTQCHNIWVDNANNMITCHSPASSLVDVKTGEVLWASGGNGYLRGLAVTTDFILVGETAVAERQDRAQTYGGIWLIDRKTLQTTDYLPMVYPGPITEIRILDMPDEAHHGKIFKHIDLLDIDHSETLEQKSAKSIENICQDKLMKNQAWLLHKNMTNQFDCLSNALKVSEEGWLQALDNEKEVCAIAKKKVKKHFNISVEYEFKTHEEKNDQHISLIIGYKNDSVASMLALLLHCSKDKISLSLWKKSNNEWIMLNNEKPFTQNITEKKGTLRIHRDENCLTLYCNDMSFVFHSTNQELNGDVGVRCFGAQFKNFSIEVLTRDLKNFLSSDRA